MAPVTDAARAAVRRRQRRGAPDGGAPPGSRGRPYRGAGSVARCRCAGRPRRRTDARSAGAVARDRDQPAGAVGARFGTHAEGLRTARRPLAQGVHPADAPLPRCLPLLHLRRATAARRARVHDGGRSAGGGPRRCRGGLRRGAVHARRQARTALSHGARGVGDARLREHAGVPRALRAAGLRGDRAAAASQPGGHGRGRARDAAAGRGVDGADVRERCGAADAEGRAAPSLTRQAARDTACHARGCGAPRHPDDHGAADRHR